MKIGDWSNLEKYGFIQTSNGNYRRKRNTYYIKACLGCNEKFLGQKKNIYCSKKCALKGERNGFYGKHHTEEVKKKVSEANKDKVVSEETKEKLRTFNLGKTIPKDVRIKISESLKGRYCGELNPNYGRHHTEEAKKKISQANKGRCGLKGELNPMYNKRNEKHPNWKGGVKERNIPLYDTYAHQIDWCEEVRRNVDDPNVLEVRCTHCNKWFIPKLTNVMGRTGYLKGNYVGENRFYCSEKCKKVCPLYKKSPEQLMRDDAIRSGRLKWLELGREVQQELREMVLERDNHTCRKCGATDKPLHCHHIDPVAVNPIESADIDNCITHSERDRSRRKETHVALERQVVQCH
jgi:hypothetical protein